MQFAASANLGHLIHGSLNDLLIGTATVQTVGPLVFKGLPEQHHLRRPYSADAPCWRDCG
ncbi:MAG: hypothetical protein H6816_05040 [Phycisphaerales bacterium]|nr:hypothetical protein [Phycisphaerales bacterium]